MMQKQDGAVLEGAEGRWVGWWGEVKVMERGDMGSRREEEGRMDERC